MSRSGTPSGRSTFASKTIFEGLAVDSGEESEEEISEPVIEPSGSEKITETQEKISKTALKKAAKAARQEKRQQEKLTKEKSRPLSDVEPRSTITPENAAGPVPGTSHDSVEIQTISAVEPQPLPDYDEVVVVESTIVTNGDAHATEDGEGVQSSIPPDSMATSAGQSPFTSGFATPYDKKDPNATQGDFGQAVQDRLHTQEAEQTKKRQAIWTRTLWTLIMISGFIGLLLLGHAYMVLLVMLCQTLVYREVTALFSLKSTTPKAGHVESTTRQDPWSKTLNWYFFAVTNYFLYGESIIYYFKHVVFADAQLLPFATNHRILSFTLYTIGFMGFVMSLKKGYLKQQFGLFCWVHMTLLLIVVSSHFIVNNILEGLIWFWVPASLVICNDVFAYIWGISFGRTPLIALSPKKTVEGFVGAFWSTIVFGVLWGTYFMKFDYMICPVRNLGVSAWSEVGCEPNDVFVWREFDMWRPVAMFLSTLIGRTVTTIPYVPYQFHLLFMSMFASLVAPFGGFFASGFKRAFDIKDFGHSIPGHGGMTDRMDCQFLMGVFTYVYYSSLIREHHVTVGSILQTIVSGLSVDDQVLLLRDLKGYLEGQGVRI